MKKYLLFDLDGTLTDPKLGITTCVQYALHSMGIEEPDLDKLEPFIGPPLKESFMNFYNMDEARAEEAVAKYRERFQDIGIFENKLYKGIPEMLRTLQSRGIFLAVASSKPTVFVERILEHFNIAKYFKVVVGSELDGTRVDKAEVVQEALNQLFAYKPVRKAEVYMIGDRKFDVEGAKALRIESVAVTYGYGSMEELKAAKADYIVQSVEELQSFLLRGTENLQNPQQQKSRGFQRIWVMIYSFLLFMLVRSIVESVAAQFVVSLSATMPKTLSDFFIAEMTAETVRFTGDAVTLIRALGFIAGILPSYSTAKKLIAKTAEESKLSYIKQEPALNYLLIGLLTIGAAVGLNMLFELLGITATSESYQAVVADQYSASFMVGILCYGFVTPIAEELLFRGIIYNFLKRITMSRYAVIISAFVFAVYHMNAVQGAYALLMGFLIAYAYEYFGDFYMPVMVHIISNVVVYCLSYTGIAISGFINWPVCIILLAIAVVSLVLLRRQKRIYW